MLDLIFYNPFKLKDSKNMLSEIEMPENKKIDTLKVEDIKKRKDEKSKNEAIKARNILKSRKTAAFA